ncbi:RDD family protein [Nannocystaceae bacterium ST9]
MSDYPYGPPPPSPPTPYGAPPINPYAQANPYANQNPYAGPFGNPQAGPPGAGPGGFNPYAPPSSQADLAFGSPGYAFHAGEQLAERGTRLGAVIVDNMLYAGAIFVGALPASVMGEEAAIIAGVLAVLALAVYQWVLVANTGQSLAKRWFGIRIVKLDGSLPGFVHGVLLRSWVTGLITSLISILGLVDALLIFGDDRRCLHDHLAGTKVVVAR